MLLPRRMCPNKRCGKPTILSGYFCKYCGTEMPLPNTKKERREMLKYQIHEIPRENESCLDIYHFIVVSCGGKFCDQCGKKFESADDYIPKA